MEPLKITIFDAETGETIIRDMTDEEIAQIPVIESPYNDAEQPA